MGHVCSAGQRTTMAWHVVYRNFRIYGKTLNGQSFVWVTLRDITEITDKIKNACRLRTNRFVRFSWTSYTRTIFAPHNGKSQCTYDLTRVHWNYVTADSNASTILLGSNEIRKIFFFRLIDTNGDYLIVCPNETEPRIRYFNLRKCDFWFFPI